MEMSVCFIKRRLLGSEGEIIEERDAVGFGVQPLRKRAGRLDVVFDEQCFHSSKGRIPGGTAKQVNLQTTNARGSCRSERWQHQRSPRRSIRRFLRPSVSG